MTKRMLLHVSQAWCGISGVIVSGGATEPMRRMRSPLYLFILTMVTPVRNACFSKPFRNHAKKAHLEPATSESLAVAIAPALLAHCPQTDRFQITALSPDVSFSLLHQLCRFYSRISSDSSLTICTLPSNPSSPQHTVVHRFSHLYTCRHCSPPGLELNLQTLQPSRTGVKPADTAPSRTGVKPADTLNLQTLRPSRTGVKPADTAALQDWRLELNLQTLRPSRTGVKPADTAALQDWSFDTPQCQHDFPGLGVGGGVGHVTWAHLRARACGNSFNNASVTVSSCDRNTLYRTPQSHREPFAGVSTLGGPPSSAAAVFARPRADLLAASEKTSPRNTLSNQRCGDRQVLSGSRAVSSTAFFQALLLPGSCRFCARLPAKALPKSASQAALCGPANQGLALRGPANQILAMPDRTIRD
ncbi:hypothetical protein JZ751_006364 [Albula glossodonta]|uniref:Uncharacterized protein n=1 Tax=Albula glossodonta TaxID=121402 RepID=A0A8T2N4C4_9TELE|nr:hypothetical protein JZ751_006364 [Albula glossodonta]